MLFKAEDLSKKYNGKLVLDKFSFEADKGQIVGIYGQSGAGKSTVAKIICGAEKPDSGSFTEFGLKIQMIYQQPWSSLDPSQKIGKGFEELVKYHHFADGKESAEKLIKKQIAEVGLSEEILGHLPYQISGGEAQRVAIAKALMFDPDILVMDEATSMLDVLTQASIMDLVKKTVIRKGGSVILISHDLEFVNFVCDKIYYLEGL